MIMDDSIKKQILLMALEECLAYVYEVISPHTNYQGICKGLDLNGIKKIIQPFILEEASQYSVKDLENLIATPPNAFSLFVEYVSRRYQDLLEQDTFESIFSRYLKEKNDI